jgi:hypothetical protein
MENAGKRRVQAPGSARKFVAADEVANESDCDDSASISFWVFDAKKPVATNRRVVRRVVAMICVHNNL